MLPTPDCYLWECKESVDYLHFEFSLNKPQAKLLSQPL